MLWTYNPSGKAEITLCEMNPSCRKLSKPVKRTLPDKGKVKIGLNATKIALSGAIFLFFYKNHHENLHISEFLYNFVADFCIQRFEIILK